MKNNYRALGLMSGTSLDGLDMAFCQFVFHHGQWTYHLEATRHIPYPQAMEEDLRDAVHWDAVDLLALDVRYGRWLGEQVNHFLASNHLEVDLVASHGHTIHHRPERGFTLQIGHGRALADTCGRVVVSDFRMRDVLRGGQGAPLVPIGDEWLFGEYDFCLNLGGFANMSFRHEGVRKAYDLGMANIGLNDLARQQGLPFDQDGVMARSGSLVPALLRALDALPYYQLPLPKSTGYEWYLQSVKPLLAQHPATVADWMHTLVHHMTSMIGRDLMAWARKPNNRVLVTGGGARNGYFVECLRKKLGSDWTLVIPNDQLVDFKEALVFAFMGVLRLRREVNCLSSVTGAAESVSGGEVF